MGKEGKWSRACVMAWDRWAPSTDPTVFFNAKLDVFKQSSTMCVHVMHSINLSTCSLLHSGLFTPRSLSSCTWPTIICSLALWNPETHWRKSETGSISLGWCRGFASSAKNVNAPHRMVQCQCCSYCCQSSWSLSVRFVWIS